MLVYTAIKVEDLKIGDKFRVSPNNLLLLHTVNCVMTREGKIMIFADDNDPLVYFLFSLGKQVYFESEDGSRDIVINLSSNQLKQIANWKSGAVVNRDASDEECREFVYGAMNDLLSLVADLWPIQSSSEGEK